MNDDFLLRRLYYDDYDIFATIGDVLCPFLAVPMQFDSDHHQNRRLSSHSYSHESVIFLIKVSPLYYDREQQVVHSGISYWVEGR